jgi:predicted nucleic acid-binding protein
MGELVDTCGWIEWLTDGPLAATFEPRLLQRGQLVVPTAVQFELYKWVKREHDESRALEVVALTDQAEVVALTSTIALMAGDLALTHSLSFADALIYATALHHGVALVTCDDHFAGLAGVIFHSKG